MLQFPEYKPVAHVRIRGLRKSVPFLPPSLPPYFLPSLLTAYAEVGDAGQRARQMPSHAHVIFLYRNVQQVAKRAIIT